MKFSSRGIALVAVVAVAFLLAQLHGARALGAVVVPGLLVLGAAAWQVNRARKPTVTREPPAEGPVGQRGTVRLTAESSDAGQLLVRDQLSTGFVPIESSPQTESSDESDISARLSALTAIDPLQRLTNRFRAVVEDDTESAVTVRTVSGSTAAYDVRFHARGEWTLGPAQLVVRDVFGLFEQVYTVDDTDTVLVFPTVRRLLPNAYRQLLTAAGTGSGDERTVFDGLREYDTGDPLRDIHWRISAKRDELIVTEYAEGSTDDRVTIAATATAESVDAMAEAAASLAIALLDAGIPVALGLPGASVTANPGERRAVLATLARVTVEDASAPGTDGTHLDVPQANADTDVQVDATPDGVDVRIGDVHSPFETLVGESTNSGQTHAEDSTWFSDPRTVIGPNRHRVSGRIDEQSDTSTVGGRTDTDATNEQTTS